MRSGCIPFDGGITSHPDSSGVLQQVGWIKVMSCIEMGFSAKINPFTIHRHDYINLSLQAISIKFEPTGGINNSNYNNLALIAKPESNPIKFGLAHRKEVSYQYDSNGNIICYGSTNNWIGSSAALERLKQKGYYSKPAAASGAYPNDLSEIIYHAWGNHHGLHIFPNTNGSVFYQCTWDKNKLIGEDIEIYFGFEPQDCDTYNSTAAPTSQPSTHIDKDSSSDPANHSIPSEIPSIAPIFNTLYFPFSSNIETTEPLAQSSLISEGISVIYTLLLTLKLFDHSYLS